MKQISHAAIKILFLLLIISSTSARVLSSPQGENLHIERSEIILQEDDFSSLMGLEICGDKDEACQKRRIVAEAHLDYIYTQHNKP